MRSTTLLLTASLLVALAAASPYGGLAAHPTADYSYSYSSGVSGAQETRAGSLTQGGFSYVDANGQVQWRRYEADAARGFVVTATDAQEPVRDTPEVARAKQEHLAAVARAAALVSGGGAAVAAPQPVADTPEVAAARAHHLAIVQDVRARGASGVVSVTPTPLPAVASWTTPSSLYAQQRVWTVSSTPAPVQDTVEVAAAKAKHFAAVQEANARAAVASQQSYQHSGAYQQQQQQQHHHQQYSVTPSPVQETPEVAAAKAQHLAAVAQAAARVSSSNSLASGYAVPAAAVSRFHYPNVPGDLVPRVPAPAPAAVPAWPAANVAVRYNTVEDDTGRYVPDDEGQYDSRLDAEGQYDPRLDAEGQYIPSLNDEGQWVPSANEGQYIAGREDQSGEDNMPYSYSYSDGLSSKTETKTADGLTRGRFSYVDANGVLQAVDYEADNYNGFRASGTNLPQAPAAAPSGRIYHPPGPAYPVPAQVFQAPIAAYSVQPIHPRPIAAAYAAPAVPDVPADTPEVAAAKAAHFAAHREAGARLANAYSG